MRDEILDLLDRMKNADPFESQRFAEQIARLVRESTAADARRFRALHSHLGYCAEISPHYSAFAGMSLDDLRKWCDGDAPPPPEPRPGNSKDPAERFEQAARREEAEARDARGFHYLARLATARRLREYAELFHDAEDLGVCQKLVAEAIRDALIQEIEDLLEATS